MDHADRLWRRRGGDGDPVPQGKLQGGPGTAATLSPVGELVYNGEEILVRDGQPGPNRAKLQKALQDIQYGFATDTHGWLTEVG